MKIEEIKGYLGTGVNYYLPDSFIQRKVELTVYNLESFSRGDYPLILRQLSDLTKENADFLSSNGYMDVCEECVYIDEMQYSDVLKLQEKHFDIHGLIEKGEAIDINTL